MSYKVNEFTGFSKQTKPYIMVLESIEEGLEDNDTVLINKVTQINIEIKILNTSLNVPIAFKEDESLIKCIVRIVSESIETI